MTDLEELKRRFAMSGDRAESDEALVEWMEEVNRRIEHDD